MICEPTLISNGLMVFSGALEPPGEDILSICESSYERCLERDYIWVDDDWAVNRSMHRFSRESISHQSVHLVGIDDPATASPAVVSYFSYLDKCTYAGLLRYIEEYPSLLGNIWWRTKGHAIFYKPGSWMGLHNDNDANYHPYHEPDHQLALRHVVGVLIFLTSSTGGATSSSGHSGGEIIFPYIGYTHRPMAGDMLIFPSNFYGSHEVRQVVSGSRISYISYFGHGSADPSRGICISNTSDGYTAAQIWERSVVDDYTQYINEKYPGPENQLDRNSKLSQLRKTRPSDNTVAEIGEGRFTTGFDVNDI